MNTRSEKNRNPSNAQENQSGILESESDGPPVQSNSSVSEITEQSKSRIADKVRTDLRGQIFIDKAQSRVPSVKINIYLFDRTPSGKFFLARKSKTDNLGTYYLNDIPNGTYYLQVDGKNYQITVKNPDASGESVADQDIPPIVIGSDN